MIDKAKLDQMFDNLRQFTAELRRLGQVPKDALLASGDMIGNAKYHFVIAIECCIDIAYHIISSETLRIPHDNADSFAVLVENGYVSPSLLDSLKAMARFRNRLVHLYWDIDDERIHTYLQDALPDIDTYMNQIGAKLG